MKNKIFNQSIDGRTCWLLILIFFFLVTSCNKKTSFVSNKSMSVEEEVDYLSMHTCVQHFYVLREKNSQTGITINIYTQPKKFVFDWGKPSIDNEIYIAMSKIGQSERGAIGLLNSDNTGMEERFEVVEKLAEIAMSTKFYSSCKEHVLTIRKECLSIDGRLYKSRCYDQRFSWYKYFVSQYIVNKAVSGYVDMSQFPIPTKKEIEEISSY